MRESARERLVHLVQNLEALEERRAAAGEALRNAFDDAKRVGYDPSTLKVVLRLRKLTPYERKERRALEAIYLAALGMLEGDPLPDEARRRLDEPEPSAQPPSPKPTGKGAKPQPGRQATPAPPTPPPPAPPQPQLPLKDPEEARQEGRSAAAAGKRIYDNPFPAGDPCRAAWDEGWCEKRQSHGMDTPAAYQRRSKLPDQAEQKGQPDKAQGDGDAEKKGAA